MGIRDWLANRIGGRDLRRQTEELVASKVEEAVAKAVEARGVEAAGSTARKEDVGWTRITSKSERDLGLDKVKRQGDICYHLWLSNPLAKRIIEIQVEHVVGDGVTYSSDDEKVKEVLDAFWSDSVNNWPLKLERKVEELAIFGEQAWPTFVRESDGRVRLGLIDPGNIKSVNQNPENPEIIDSITLKDNPDGTPGRTYSVIREDDDPTSDTYGLLVGECFYFSVNRVSNASRGVSDLFPLADWLDGYDQFVFHSLERSVFLHYFIWDILIEGADEDQIREKLADIKQNPPKPGGYRVHNEKEKWSAIAPDLNAAEISEIGRLVKLLILAGAGYPEHWFADGEGTGRAVGVEQGAPTYRKLQSRQKYWIHILEYVFRYVIDQAIIAKKLPAEVNKSVRVSMPDVSTKDTSRIAAASTHVATSLTQAVAQRWITNDKAAHIWANLMGQLGVEIDADTELKALEKDGPDTFTANMGAALKQAMDKLRRQSQDNLLGGAKDEVA